MDIYYTRQSKAKKIKNSEGEWIKEEDPLSHQVQIEEIHKQRGDIPYIAFSETDVSRDETLKKRPILQQALAKLKKGDTLVAWKSNRLAADNNVLSQIMFEVASRKAEVYIVNEPEFFKEGPVPELIRTLMTGINKYEVSNIRHTIKSTLETKKQRGERVGHIPYGYCLGEAKKLLPDDVEQQTLNLMAELYFSSGYTYRQVGEYLNSAEIPNREGLPWSHSSVYRILKNRKGHAVAYLPKKYPALHIQ